MARPNELKAKAAEFEDTIQSARQKREVERIAADIFGKSKQDRAPTGRKQLALPNSLSSRMGIAKRSASNQDIRRTRSPVPAQPAALLSRIQKNNQFLNAALTQINSQPNASSGNTGFSIKGAAGPYYIHMRNLAPGTTAPDIKTFVSDTTGETPECKILAAKPLVSAEIVFQDKKAADTLIEKLHNQADGRVIKVFYRTGPPPASNIIPAADGTTIPTGPRAARRDLFERQTNPRKQDVMDIDDQTRPSSGRLYSDSLIKNRQPRHRGRGRGHRS